DLSVELPGLVPRLERAEATALVDFAHSASPRVATRLGIALHQQGDLVALRTAGADVLNLNRVMGVELDSPVDPGALERLIPRLPPRRSTCRGKRPGSGSRQPPPRTAEKVRRAA